MLDWLFKPANNGYSREVTVSSSRHKDRVFRVESDLRIDAIDAVRIVHDGLPPLEPGESRNTGTPLI